VHIQLPNLENICNSNDEDETNQRLGVGHDNDNALLMLAGIIFWN